MASIVDICNMALMRFGNSQTISDLNETSSAANALRLFYPLCRDAVLQGARWNFATKRQALALLPSTETNWAYAYAYPTDCLAVHALALEGMRLPPVDQRPPFEVAVKAGAVVILTDLEQAEAVYTARVENPNLFTPLFVSALVELLASKCVVPLTGKPELVQGILNTYAVFLAQAQAADANEGDSGPGPENEFLAVRR